MNAGQKYVFLMSVGSLFDGTLDAAGESRLTRQLASDDDACELYSKFVAFDVELRWALSAGLQRELLANLAAGLDVEAPINLPELDWVISPAKPHVAAVAARFSRPVIWSILLCAVLFAAYFVGISWDMLKNSVADRGEAVVAHADPVATLRGTSNVEWSDQVGKSLRDLQSASRRDASTEISAGESLSIASGLVELQLKQGVTLLIEGPADWSVDGENAATLTRGKLVAKVPEHAIGFTLKTPTARIVDLGTEFGAEVSDSGEVQVSVFRGVVETHSRHPGSQPLQITAGQSAKFAAATYSVESIPFVESPFTQLRQYQPKGSTSGDLVLLFADNFDTPTTIAEISPTAVSRSQRQSGFFRQGLSYNEWRSDNRPNSPEDDRASLVAGEGGGRLRVVAKHSSVVAVSPNANFRAEHRDGTRFVVEFEVSPANYANGITPPKSDNWAGVIVGCTSQNSLVGQPGGISLLIRRDGRYTVFDGTGGQVSVVVNKPLPPEAVPADRTFHVRMEYELARFDGPNPVEVRIDVNDVRVAQFTSRQSLLENYIVLQSHTSDQPIFSEFDNLSISEQALPVPAGKHNNQQVD